MWHLTHVLLGFLSSNWGYELFSGHTQYVFNIKMKIIEFTVSKY